MKNKKVLFGVLAVVVVIAAAVLAGGGKMFTGSIANLSVSNKTVDTRTLSNTNTANLTLPIKVEKLNATGYFGGLGKMSTLFTGKITAGNKDQKISYMLFFASNNVTYKNCTLGFSEPSTNTIEKSYAKDVASGFDFKTDYTVPANKSKTFFLNCVIDSITNQTWDNSTMTFGRFDSNGVVYSNQDLVINTKIK